MIELKMLSTQPKNYRYNRNRHPYLYFLRFTLPMKTRCQTPAKLILTGEHSVLHGATALSLAININTTCQCLFTASKTRDQEEAYFEIELPDCNQKAIFPVKLWQKMAIDIESRFQLFEENTLAINSVLRQPMDLVLCCLYLFHQQYAIKQGQWHIKVSGHTLIGRGLGSSSAVILSILYNLYQQHDLSPPVTEILDLATRIENRQHGHSSGLDPATILSGGMVEYSLEEGLKKLDSEHFKAWVIDTGHPQSSTGQTVKAVMINFPKEHNIWQEFKAVSSQMMQAWKKQDNAQFIHSLKHNQKLLAEIGVVPGRVQQFIKRLPEHDVAKVCGAGSLEGQAAGVLLCICDEPPVALCKEFGYTLLPIEMSLKGPVCEVVN